MADVRINALATTASSSASDDYVAIDGSANGTRKLSAYSPSFGGNATVGGTLTVSGTGKNSFSKAVFASGGYVDGPGAGEAMLAGATTLGAIVCGSGSTNDVTLWNKNGSAALSVPTGTTNVGVAGNLTVSGTGTSTFAGPVGVTQTLFGGAGTFSYSGINVPYYGVSWQDLSGGATGPSALLSGYGGIRFFATGAFAGAFAPTTGNLLLGTTTDNSATFAVNRTGTGPANSGAISTAALRAVDVTGDLALDIGVNSGVSPYPGWIQVHGRTNQATNYPLALNPNGGDVLFGTTTNSGNGKLQLATHTTSAGGIGFGTDVSLFRRTTSALRAYANSGYTFFELQGASGAYLDFYAADGTTKNGFIGHESAGGMYIQSATSQSIFLRPNGGTLALTLDSSANATFAGMITVNTGGSRLYGTAAANSNALELVPTVGAVGRWSTLTLYSTLDSTGGAYNSLRITGAGSAGYASASNYVDFERYNGSAWVQQLRLRQDGAIITEGLLSVGGALKLGNAYAAGAPTATGYVTIQDSSGTTYKVLVST